MGVAQLEHGCLAKELHWVGAQLSKRHAEIKDCFEKLLFMYLELDCSVEKDLYEIVVHLKGY